MSETKTARLVVLITELENEVYKINQSTYLYDRICDIFGDAIPEHSSIEEIINVVGSVFHENERNKAEIEYLEQENKALINRLDEIEVG